MNASKLAQPARIFLATQARLGRWLILGTILAAHGGAYLALKASMVPTIIAPPEPREIFAMLIAPPTPPQPQVTPPQPAPPPPEPVPPPPKPVVQKPKPKPKPKRAEPVIPAPVLPPSETAITQEAVEPVVEPTPPAPAVVQADPAPPAPVAAPVAAPPPAGPRTISAVEYLVPPQPAYPPLSRRAGESGQVLLRILVNQAGRPEKVEVQKSSGYTRLDDAARAAAMRARFKPHRENGSAVAVYALVPVNFSIQ